MDKNLQLTLKINADTSGLNQALAGVGAGVKRVKVPVDLEPSTKDLGINIRARLDGAGEDFGRAAATQIGKTAVKADFGSYVADQLANRIAKATGSAVEDAVRKASKGNLLGAIGGLIGKAVSIPVQAVTGTAKAALQGVFNGATATARTAFQGVVFGATQSASAELGRGINAGLQKAFGSTIGSPELIGRKLIEKLGQSISQTAEKAANAVGVDLPKVGQVVKRTLGEQEVLTDSRAKSAEDRQVKTQRKESAQVELNRERQEAFRTQTAAVESYARITQAIERQSRELVKKNADTIRKLQSKLSELAAEAAQDTTEPVGQDLVKAFQAEIRKAKVSLKEIQQARVEAAAEFEAAIASATTDDEKGNIKEQARAYQVALRKELQGGFSNLLNDLLAPAVELEQIQKEAKTKLDEAFAGSREAKANFAVVKGGEAYRTNLEANAKVLDKQQIELAERIQQRQQVLKKGLETEAAISKKLQTAPDTQKDELAQLQAEAQRTVKAIAKEINDLKEARAKLTDEIAVLAQQARAVPKEPNKVIAGILKEFGAEGLPPEQVPQVQLATDASLKSTTTAQYLPELNVIQVRAELFDALQTATSALELTGDQQRDIREEVFHALQVGFGSLEGLEAFNAREPLVRPAQIQPEEIRQAGKNLNYYAPDVQQIELEAKVAANRATSAAEESAAKKTQQQELFKKAGFGGIQGTEILGEALQRATVSVQGIEQRARELGRNLDSSELKQALTTVSADLERFGSDALQVAAGEFDSIKISGINQDFERIKATLLGLNSSIADLAAGLERQAAEVKQSSNIDHALAIVAESGGAVSKSLDHLGSKLAPAANVVGGAIDYTTRGLVAVGKAGLALADKLGFAAASFIPGGALAYGPAKAAVKFAGPAIAAGALATQVPAAGEIISAISSTIGAILAPATSGLSASVGHAVSTEIAGALPSLFSALSHAVTESGLPGSQLTAVAVDKLGGGLIHLLEPMVGGVANAADSTILSVGHAVNEFLGQVGAMLLAGKGLQEGVKLATSPEARSTALETVQAVGSGVGQTIGGITEGVEGIKDALGRTQRAVEQNISEIKTGTQELAQGNLGAIADIKDSAESAVSNISRGVQDVGKAVGTAGQQVKEGVQKVAKVTLSGAVRLPEGLDIGELSKDALIGLAQQFKGKLVKTLEAEASAAQASNATGTGRSGLLKSDLNKILGVLIDKLDGSIETHAVELEREFGAILPDLRPRLNLPQFEPIEVQPKTIEIKAQAIELNIPKTTYDVPSQVVEVKVEAVELEVAPVQAPIEPKNKLDQFREQLTRLDEARDNKIEDIRSTYQALQKDVSKSKTAAKKGDVLKLKELQEAIAAKRTKIFKEVEDLSRETDEILQALNALGIETGANTPIRDRIAALRQSLTKTKQGTLRQVAEVGNIPGAEPFEGLQSISIEPIQQSIEQGARSLSGAFKSLIETIFEVKGETLSESLALAAQSPRGKDLAVNTAGLAASVAASSQGPVAGIAADLVGALAARQALGGGGAETFGDITGFITGNAANKLTGIPGSGAVAASLVVPQLQKLRDQIQAKYGQPIEIEVPVDLQFEGLQSVNSEVAQAHQQVEQIDALLAELRQLEAEGKLVTPTVGDRISGFLESISKAFSKADTGEIALAIARIETELARAGDSVSAQLSEETQRVEQESEQLAREFDKATGRIESSLYEFDRVKDKVDEQVIRASAKAEVSGAPLQAQPSVPEPELQTENQKTQQRLLQLEAERQRRITELDGLIASETARIGDEKAEQIVSLKRQRANLNRPVQQYQAEDLGQFITPKSTVNPTGEERGLVAQQRLERDASERQINDTLRRGKAPTGSADEIQLMADSAIASFDKNFAKFNVASEQIEQGSTRTQKALRTVGQSVSTFKEKLGEAGGISGVLGKVGQSLTNVAERAGLPVGAIGKLGNVIKGVGIAALAYLGITQLGDAIVQIGQKAIATSLQFETLQTRLNFISGGKKIGEQETKDLEGLAERLKQPLDKVIQGYADLKIATKGTAIEGGKTKEIYESLQSVGRTLGISADDLAGVQVQISQIFRRGKAQTEDLRSISDRGADIFKALAQSYETSDIDKQKRLQDLKQVGVESGAAYEQASNQIGVSTADILDKLDRGEISAKNVADALTLLGKEAKTGLPEALDTGAASIDDFNRQTQLFLKGLGDAFKPIQIVGIGLLSAAFNNLQETGSRLAPVFGAIGNGIGLILDIARPIAGVIEAVFGAVQKDLQDGVAIPFQAINAGLTEIRAGFAAVESVAGQALSAIGEQTKGLVSAVPFLGELLKYANPVTLAIRALGVAIGVYLVAQMTQMAITIGTVVVTSLISMAGTITATVIPALGTATAAALAFIATPIGATITAIGIAAALAAPHIDEMANALSGVRDVKGNDAAIDFNEKYAKSLDQLQKGIPLTDAELKDLKDGFEANAKSGRSSAGEVATLTGNLDRLQGSAKAAATLQQRLATQLALTTAEIADQGRALELGFAKKTEALNAAYAGSRLSRDEFNREDLAAQTDQANSLLNLYQGQSEVLKTSLAEAQAQLAGPIPQEARGQIIEGAKKINDQILDLDLKSTQQRTQIAKNAASQRDTLDALKVKQTEEGQKTIENLVAAGVLNQIDGDHAVTESKKAEFQRQIDIVNESINIEVNAGREKGEVAKALFAQRAELESEVTKVAAEEVNKRYDILLREVENRRDALTNAVSEAETEANIELQDAQNKGLLKQAEVEAEKTNLTRSRLQQDLALELANLESIKALPSPTDPVKIEEHQKRIRESHLKTAQITQQIAENEYKRQEAIRNLAAKALDEQVKGAENAATAVEQISKIAINSVERQNKLLEAQKSLQSSIAGLRDQEYKILIDTAKNERDKAELQQAAAKSRLNSLRQSQTLEERILELQIKQEQVQNRVAIIKAQAAVAKAEAEQAKVNANPESTEADKQAAALSVQAAQIDLGGTVEQSRLQEQLSDYKRQQSRVDNRKALLGARFDYANAIVDPVDKRDAIERIQADAARGLRERTQMVLPIGNKTAAPAPDYSQVDAAAQQLGLMSKGATLGRFVLPTPVDLRSGLNPSQGLQVGNLSDELKVLRDLTQAGVVGNLLKLVDQNRTLSGQLMGLANRPQVVQNINQKNVRRTADTGFAGLPL